MRKWQAIPVAGAAALIAAVAMTLPALLTTRSAGAVTGTTVQMEVDCDTSTSGVQNSCNISTASVAAVPIDVVVSNFQPLGGTQVDSFNYDLYNDQCADPDFGSCHNGDTTNPAGGIGPAVPVPDAANFPAANYSCSSPPPQDDTGSGAPGTSTSFLACALKPGTGAALALANGASARVSSEGFSDNVTAATTIVLTLSNVAVADDNAVTTVKCDPFAAPPVSPEGNTNGPCFPATLCFLTGGVGTCALPATPVPTATPGTPTATATPCAPNCPPTATPTSLHFVTITPNAATLTAIAGTAVPATAVPPPPAPPPPGGGEQPGGGGQPTGNTPGGGAGSGQITLPDTGAGHDGGIDWTAASLLALVAVAIGGAAGAMYLGAAHVSASRRDRDGD